MATASSRGAIAARIGPTHALYRSVAAVVSGHSHRPGQAERDGVLFFNPGSAGPRRFRLPVSVGRLTVAGGRVTGALVALEVAS